MSHTSAGAAFKLITPYQPTGDQPEAINAICNRLSEGEQAVTLLGATGTGKTFTMANVIARMNKPTLILSHNKTLAAQLYEEMKELFPENAVSYFVSYYDYYQPEAYIPQRDIYIEKETARNDDLDRLRLAATSALLSRRDTIVVASVSCIFGLGSPDAYKDKVLTATRGMTIDRRQFLLALADMQYQRAEIDFKRSTYRVRGDTIELYPAYEQFAVRFEFFGDDLETIALIDPLTGDILADEQLFHIFPAVHHVMPEEHKAAALQSIREELDARVLQLRSEGKLLEAQRLLARTRYDIEMIEESGYCNGIENYSRFFDGRNPGDKPNTLLDYFHRSGTNPEDRDWLMFIDESHVTLPQIRAMYNGDYARKKILVDHGFRLPSAYDNRPLRFDEFETEPPAVVYVSATPGPYELQRTLGEVVEQVIRPTGLIDPEVEVRRAEGQIHDVMEECRLRVERKERVLITALTKRLCEDLTAFLDKNGFKVRYLHSEIDTLERLEILRDLRLGEFDILVGVNLLREGLDLPEVSLVCILDADKTGFLRGETALIQTIGRAARNIEGKVIMYADTMTPPMRAAIDETNRRRAKQLAYNQANNITPQTIQKAIRRGIENELKATHTARAAVQSTEASYEASELLSMLEEEMLQAAQELQFEKAADLRDMLKKLREAPELLMTGERIRLSDLKAATGSKRNKPGAAGSKVGQTTRKPKRSKNSE